MTAPERKALRGVLTAHAARYPAMRPQDAVKLLYQNEFGGGHLISDPAQSLRRLREEYASVPCDPAAPLSEDIGNGMVRVQLSALSEAEYPLQALCRDFVRSAREQSGNEDALAEKLDVLRAMADAGELPFSGEALEAYLALWSAFGCPPVSHSPEYQAAYAPAYRVLRRAVSLPLLLRETAALAETRERVLVGLDGRCASGKTTLAAHLQARFGWGVVHLDHFFLRPEQRTEARYAEPGGNFDRERFLEEVLLPLRAGTLTEYRPFDCHALRLSEPVPVLRTPVTLIEGSYACHPALWESYDLRVFLTVDPAEQFRRVEAREGTKNARLFRDRWIPMEEAYISAFSPETRCDYCLEL